MAAFTTLLIGFVGVVVFFVGLTAPDISEQTQSEEPDRFEREVKTTTWEQKGRLKAYVDPDLIRRPKCH